MLYEFYNNYCLYKLCRACFARVKMTPESKSKVCIFLLQLTYFLDVPFPPLADAAAPECPAIANKFWVPFLIFEIEVIPWEYIAKVGSA